MRNVLLKQSLCVFVLVLVFALEVVATNYRPIVLDPNYSHDRWGTSPQDIVSEFRAYTVSFDSKDDDVAMGVPEWVSSHVVRLASDRANRGLGIVLICAENESRCDFRLILHDFADYCDNRRPFTHKKHKSR